MQKKTILLLADHPLSTSGVGTQARWLIHGLIATGKYRFKCFGGAMKHEDYRTVVVNEDFIIKPTNGFGDRNLLRQVLATERPDALMLFTDPRFFIWVWEMEDEIHQICPIAYNHLWDNAPWPEFNKVLYESTDLINCINWPTYQMVKERFPEKTNYIPHAVPNEIYYPISDDESKAQKIKLLGKDRADHFTALFVSRNARRKMPSDILVSWKQFLDRLQEKYGHKKATMLMHTDPLDQEGPNLLVVTEMLGIKDSVFFSNQRVEFEKMNVFHNITDACLNISFAEGFGLATLEAMQCGNPIIALKTGGLTRQVVDHRDGSENGIALPVEMQTLVGSQLVPYIYEDYVSNETVAHAIHQMYLWGPEKRKMVGNKAKDYVDSEFNLETTVNKWHETLTDLCDNWKSKKRWHLEEITK